MLSVLVAMKTFGFIYFFRFIDYQFSHFNSPVIDIVYFVHSSLEKQSIVSHIPDVLKAYHEELVNTFALLNHKVDNVPSLEELIKEFNRKYVMCLPVSTVVLPIVRSTAGIDIGEAFGNQNMETEKHAYTNKVYTDIMRHLLPELTLRDVI